mmetsp:Transcript_38106/g.115191  ORF Transcript_38106/g.115191 Transcript_38106/m.115191 type:complete len:523 (-) Transcript_38106:221-1789(-)
MPGITTFDPELLSVKLLHLAEVASPTCKGSKSNIGDTSLSLLTLLLSAMSIAETGVFRKIATRSWMGWDSASAPLEPSIATARSANVAFRGSITVPTSCARKDCRSPVVAFCVKTTSMRLGFGSPMPATHWSTKPASMTSVSSPKDPAIPREGKMSRKVCPSISSMVKQTPACGMDTTRKRPPITSTGTTKQGTAQHIVHKAQRCGALAYDPPALSRAAQHAEEQHALARKSAASTQNTFTKAKTVVFTCRWSCPRARGLMKLANVPRTESLKFTKGSALARSCSCRLARVSRSSCFCTSSRADAKAAPTPASSAEVMDPSGPTSSSHNWHVCRRSLPPLLSGCTLAGSCSTSPIKRRVSAARVTASSMGPVLFSTASASVSIGEPSSSCWSNLHTARRAGTIPMKGGSSAPKSVLSNMCAEAHDIVWKPSRASPKPSSVLVSPKAMPPRHAAKIPNTTAFGISKGLRSLEQHRQHRQHGHVLQQQHDHTMRTKIAPMRGAARGRIQAGTRIVAATSLANSS